MPSVADIVFVALLGVLLFTTLAVRLLGDAGIGWHIRTGQLILATRTIPHTDPFSSSMAGKPWFAWEWLYDLVVGEFDARMGANGVVWFSSVVVAAVFAGTLEGLIRRGVNLLAGLILLLLAVAASMIHFLARPHVLSWLFTLAWFSILDLSERDLRKPDGGAGRRIWALPILMLVWVNVHGGFLVGFALLGIFWLGAWWDWFRAKSDRIEAALSKIAARRRARNLVWVGLAAAAASLANPYGWKLHAHIYSYLSDRFLMDHIQEFQSPDFHGAAQRCFLLLLLVVVGVLAARGRNLGTSLALVVGFALYTGLYASRNIPVSSLLLVMVVGPLVPFKPGGGFSQRMAALESGLRGHLWPVAALSLTFAIAANGGRIGRATWMDAHFDPQRMPVAALDYLEKQTLTGPVLSPDSWGGYLIYRLYPRARVVVDDRHDFYGESFFKSYLKMVRVECGWQGFLEDHEVSTVLFPRDQALTNILLQTPNWKPAYEDQVAVVLMRDPSQLEERSARGCN
jgi:hypothetical protein